MALQRDLFRGTAEFYQRFRPQYPPEVFEWIIEHYRLDGAGRLLDGGCGTGQVCLPLSQWFSEAYAVDIDPDMIALAKAAAAESRITNVLFEVAPVEVALLRRRPLRLATFGASFHWMDRVALGNEIYESLEPGGGLVLIAPSSIWRGDELWKKVVLDVIRRWLGEERRAGSGSFTPGPTHQECLAQTPFQEVETVDYYTAHNWSKDTILGYLYSTSFASQAVLGDKRALFEDDLAKSLAEVSSDDRYPDEIETTIISAQKPWTAT